MKKLKKGNEEIMYNFRIQKDLKLKYSKFCKDQGFAMSKRIRVLIIKDMEK